MASSTVENYVKEIFLLSEKSPDSDVPMGDVATALGVSAGTATTMAKALERDGWVRYTPRKGLHLTEAGRSLALGMIRRHRLVESFLVEVLKLDWSEIHEEAERLEHAISDRVLDALDSFLGHPTADPHGDPIPGPQGEFHQRQLASLRTCATDTPLQVERITDQHPEFLQFVEARGLKPGSRLSVSHRDRVGDAVTVNIRDLAEPLTLGSVAAAKILVGQTKESAD